MPSRNNLLATGESGSGKTTLIRYLGEIYRQASLKAASELHDSRAAAHAAARAAAFQTRVLTFHENLRRSDITERRHYGETGEEKTGWTMPGALSAVRVWVPLVGAATGLGFAVVAIALVVRRGTGGAIERVFHDTREALLRRDSLPVQVAMGALVMSGCLAMFFCAAHAVGAALSLFHLLALVPGILFAMSLPISIGGWGLREASALALWTMAGLPAAEALASSIVYGVITLLSCLPGAVVLLVDRQPSG